MQHIEGRLALWPVFALATLWAPLGAWAQPETGDAFSIAGVLQHRRALDRPHDVELQGNLAFVPGKGGAIAIVDVSDPVQPELVWYRQDPRRYADAETVLPVGETLLVGTDELVSLDIGNPRQPEFLGSRTTRPGIAAINGMVRRENILFAVGKNGILAAFDLAQPERSAEALDVRRRFDVGWPHDVDLYRQYAILPDPRRFGRLPEDGKLAVLRVFDPATGKLLPADRWERTGVATSRELVGANRVQVSGHHAFVGCSTGSDGGRFVVVDLIDPTSPRQVAHLRFGIHDGWGPNGLTIAGHVCFLAGGQTVEAVDIRRPDQPVQLASQRFPAILGNRQPRYQGGGDSGHDLVYRDGHLYVTGQNDNCLLILKVEDEPIRQLAAASMEE